MIKGKRVFLRPVEERDLELIAHWRNAPENRTRFFTPFLINPGAQKKWYESLIADPNRMVVMVETYEGKTVGMLGITSIDWRNQEAEATQVLLDPAERGKGYAEEAMLLGIRYAFNELNLHRIYGFTEDTNQVLALNKFLGFKQEGVLRKCLFRNGKFVDKIVFALLREEWHEDDIDLENLK